MNVSHDDGEQQLQQWTVSHEESQLHWEQSAESWERRSWDDRTWIGSSSLRAPDQEDLPRGRYAVRVTDRGGRESVAEFELRTLDFDLDNATFPELVPVETAANEAERWTVEHSGDRLIATLVDGAEEVLAQHEVVDRTLSMDDFDLSGGENREALTIYVQELRERSEVWLISGPWSL